MMELKCKLTEEDRALISGQIVEKLSQKEDYEAEKSANSSHYGGLIKGINKEIANLAKKHREGQELRLVECYTHFDWSEGIATVYRSDTNEQVSTRTITSSERQRQIDDEKENKEIEDQVDGAIDDLSGEGELIPDGQSEVARNNEGLRDLLSIVLKKAPSIKTIESYSNSEFEEARNWAVAVGSEAADDNVDVPEKPAFLGKAKEAA